MKSMMIDGEVLEAIAKELKKIREILENWYKLEKIKHEKEERKK